MKLRIRMIALILAGVGLTAAACGSPSKPAAGGSSGSNGSSGSGSLVIGSAGFTESEILAYMYADLLGKLGYHTSVTTVASSEIFTPSLEHGQLDVAPEYVATYANELDALVNHKPAGNVASPSLSVSYAALQRLAGQLGLTALAPASAVDQNAFAVSKSFASAHHLTSLSDLGASGMSVEIAGPAECATRPFCAPGLTKVYGIHVKGIDPLGFDSLQTKKAVQQGKDQLAEVATTDATLSDFNLVTLTDDKHLQNSDNVVPIVNTKTLTPKIRSALDGLSKVLTTADLGQLDNQVDGQRMTPQAVAMAYLTSKGLI